MIEIGKIGRISSGDDSGKFVKIQELHDDPPSFLILMAYDSEFKNGCGDYWVEDYDSLKGFFTESQWEIQWTEND
ncbi:hypothetical protein [Streptomyces sp. NPDC088258]|uniref:hypothetical protein n=1 Tax=Streptomyces sp. NPDC088258 TaxID=3365849 RepID=UPI0037F7EA18